MTWTGQLIYKASAESRKGKVQSATQIRLSADEQCITTQRIEITMVMDAYPTGGMLRMVRRHSKIAPSENMGLEVVIYPCLSLSC